MANPLIFFVLGRDVAPRDRFNGNSQKQCIFPLEIRQIQYENMARELYTYSKYLAQAVLWNIGPRWFLCRPSAARSVLQ